jgi:hypothetical protein
VVSHILLSLVPEEATFWMRSWPSSVLSSPSCFVNSSLFLPHSWVALTLPDDCHREICQHNVLVVPNSLQTSVHSPAGGGRVDGQ